MKFTVHTVIKNEDRWVWFALQSVLPFAEKILVFDTGSTDKTVEIVKSIKSPKIVLEERGVVDRGGLVSLRQEQLERTKTDWFLILDGDEIWPEKEFKKMLQVAEGVPKNVVALFNRTRNSIGDVYHFLPESAGKYRFGEREGNFNIRMIRKTAGLKITGEYPIESYADKNGPVEKQENNLQFADCWYLHTSFLRRSSTDACKSSGSLGKSKLWEKGIELKKEKLPEVLFRKSPFLINDPLGKRGVGYEMAAYFTTPIIQLKRKLKL